MITKHIINIKQIKYRESHLGACGCGVWDSWHYCACCMESVHAHSWNRLARLLQWCDRPQPAASCRPRCPGAWSRQPYDHNHEQQMLAAIVQIRRIHWVYSWRAAMASPLAGWLQRPWQWRHHKHRTMTNLEIAGRFADLSVCNAIATRKLACTCASFCNDQTCQRVR